MQQHISPDAKGDLKIGYWFQHIYNTSDPRKAFEKYKTIREVLTSLQHSTLHATYLETDCNNLCFLFPDPHIELYSVGWQGQIDAWIAAQRTSARVMYDQLWGKVKKKVGDGFCLYLASDGLGAHGLVRFLQYCIAQNIPVHRVVTFGECGVEKRTVVKKLRKYPTTLSHYRYGHDWRACHPFGGMGAIEGGEGIARIGTTGKTRWFSKPNNSQNQTYAGIIQKCARDPAWAAQEYSISAYMRSIKGTLQFV